MHLLFQFFSFYFLFFITFGYCRICLRTSLFSVDYIFLKMPDINFQPVFSKIHLFSVLALCVRVAMALAAAPETRPHLGTFLRARAVRNDGAHVFRRNGSRGLRAAAAGCRCRHGGQEQCACESILCVCGSFALVGEGGALVTMGRV